MKGIVIAAMVLAAFAAQADDKGMWRIGGGAAFGDFQDDNGVIDDNETGFDLYAQYQFNELFGIEGAYLNTGDFEGDFGSGVDIEKLKLSLRGFQIGGVVYVPIGVEDIDLFGKVGFYDFDADLSESGTIDSSGHYDGAWGGAGAVVKIAEQWGIRAEVDLYDIDDADFWTAIFGVEYQF